MSTGAGRCAQFELIPVHALRALPADEAAALEAHVASCARCREKLEKTRGVVESFVAWPTDVLRPTTLLWSSVLRRIGTDDARAITGLRPQQSWEETEWEDVGPGISCKLLGTDEDRVRVSMLVRLAPGASYPAHTHAGVEELHLLDGELWIDQIKLHPGDYYRGEPGTSDERVWSETGCTCVLIACPADILR